MLKVMDKMESNDLIHEKEEDSSKKIDSDSAIAREGEEMNSEPQSVTNSREENTSSNSIEVVEVTDETSPEIPKQEDTQEFNLLEEIIETERNYIRDLSHVVEVRNMKISNNSAT